MRTVFKLRSQKKGDRIHTTIFSGPEAGTLANTGTIVQTLGEWQLFGALLKLGSEYSDQTKYYSKVVFEGDQEIIEWGR